jgi:hypothetical protein
MTVVGAIQKTRGKENKTSYNDVNFTIQDAQKKKEKPRRKGR